MTISWPRELHSYQLQQCTFLLVDPTSISRTNGGKAISAVEFSDPHWRAIFRTPQLDYVERKGWTAWRNTLGGGRSFLAFDQSRAEPIAYPGGVPEILSASWDGEGTVSAIGARLITAAGAPEGFIMTAGDHIGLVQDGKYGLFEVAETVVADASSIAVPVEPAVPTTIFTTSATVVFRRPKAEFILLPDAFEAPTGTDYAPVSFEGAQKL